ncbi:hypothetical protein GGR51DRAFT_563811 [Nemania sp. FL0031]|nr:hypothetical protein GGR51DRAFT_563811 [Nemania sp. FL0031]
MSSPFSLDKASKVSPIFDSPEVSPTALDQSREIAANDRNSPRSRGSHENIETPVDRNTDQPAPEDPIILRIPDVIELMSRKKRHDVKLDGEGTVLDILRHRRQFFVIDNAESMANYWEDVVETARALSYIVKPITPRRVEIHTTIRPRTQSRWKIKSLFKKADPLDIKRPCEGDGRCLIELALDTIVYPAVKETASAQLRTEMPSLRCAPWKRSKVRGLDVYVLTDGVWDGVWGCDVTPGREKALGVENFIESAVRYLKSRNLSREFLSIHFIRFGEDRDGVRRLNWLDENIQGVVGGWDIVNTTYHKDSVWKMLINPRSANVGQVGV